VVLPLRSIHRASAVEENSPGSFHGNQGANPAGLGEVLRAHGLNHPEPTGLEPATSAVTGRRSNQLS
jgi:hypothetical protein